MASSIWHKLVRRLYRQVITFEVVDGDTVYLPVDFQGAIVECRVVSPDPGASTATLDVVNETRDNSFTILQTVIPNGATVAQSYRQTADNGKNGVTEGDVLSFTANTNTNGVAQGVALVVERSR